MVAPASNDASKEDQRALVMKALAAQRASVARPPAAARRRTARCYAVGAGTGASFAEAKSSAITVARRLSLTPAA